MVIAFTRWKPGKTLFTGGLGDAEGQGCWEPGTKEPGSKSQLGHKVSKLAVPL